MRPPRPGGLLAVDGGRPGPPLRCAEHDHRPPRPLLVAVGGPGLEDRDLVEDLVEQVREAAVCVGVIVHV
jgi:hypothetical protein